MQFHEVQESSEQDQFEIYSTSKEFALRHQTSWYRLITYQTYTIVWFYTMVSPSFLPQEDDDILKGSPFGVILWHMGTKGQAILKHEEMINILS